MQGQKQSQGKQVSCYSNKFLEFSLLSFLSIDFLWASDGVSGLHLQTIVLVVEGSDRAGSLYLGDRSPITCTKGRKLVFRAVSNTPRFRYLMVAMVASNEKLYVSLYPEDITGKEAPIASFIVKVVLFSHPYNRTFVHPAIHDMQFKNGNDFEWTINVLFSGRFTVDVEFLDLKIPSSSCGEEPSSIWYGWHAEEHPTAAIRSAAASLGLMLSEGIHTDITINFGDDSIKAHRAILASRSPVLRRMFSHNLKENVESTVDISDMSLEAGQAFLNYIYANLKYDEFITHRLALLGAADKYDIPDLMEACQESLIEDINAKNVLERLQTAHLLRLPKLKNSCMSYLVDFGMALDTRCDLNAFLHSADRELIADLFQEIRAQWKTF